jgi:dolichyl-phosphate beta-glucosyltransferase
MIQQAPNQSPIVALIIPCFNEEERLNFPLLNEYTDLISFFFVDDASTDKTYQAICQQGFPCLRLKENIGKGPAIREGMLHFKNAGMLQGFSWVGYWDADLTINLDEISGILTVAQERPDYDAFWCSRYQRFNQVSKTPLTRILLGKVFSLVVASFLKITMKDTQCGAKIFKSDLIKELFQSPLLSRWVFDLELYYRLDQKRIYEFPIKSWDDQDDSRFHLFRDGISALRDLIKIRRHYLSR